MYESDSFFTLTAPQQIGLVAMSAGLMLCWGYVAWRLGAKRPLILRIVIGVAVFASFVWLSPQIYYQYYRVIIDGLPAQWVIGWPPGPRHILRLLSFQADANLSAHSQGLLGWLLLGLAAVRR
ncbi:hypothetical protein SAMN05444273_105337 [Litoreibacter ascidiaceicola]|uniref:Uncharacterized protein n=1 Tax=Litoreibacter ascidiaceicola TaxID=1486859 RepID=A0A1M5B649_9RHOB|nr:hypothetical protein [Litoreibacter ascidiaceicola]SHF38021.1 hypothetical protein SAMN05444273_105337 [Litoreibacter ascidiaceicola]